MAEQELLTVIQRASLPAVLLHVPDAEILAASAEAGRLLGVPADRLVGRNVEEFAADRPGPVLDLIASGRLAGFESERQLLRADGQVERLQVWVRGADDGKPVAAAVVVLWPSGDRAWTYLPGPADPRLFVVGTVDAELQVERVSDDISAFGYTPTDVIGGPFLRLFDVSSAADILHGLGEAAQSKRGVGLRVHVRIDEEGAIADLMVRPLNPAPSFAFSVCLGVTAEETPSSLTSLGIERMGGNLHALSIADMLATINDRDVPGLHRLTTRELDIVGRLVSGDRVPAIARAVFLSPATVRNHLSNAFRKLGVGSQQELIELFRKSA
ncbi:MAG: PAS and helix-turn-helix domain-containing protein [Frankiales bacterium]|nr:PAS and helix-turn-helix domain-containing protein [Frankiales bacterium]